MAGQSGRWMVLAATMWVQAFTGTNFDFPAYSSALKAAMGISQVQLNYLATASDLGKAFGWSSGLALIYLPLPVVLFVAAAMGLVAYVAQWLLITGRVSLSYFPVFALCLLAGCSICWFNTICFVLCIRNFPLNRSLALALTISFNGISAALYTLTANAVDSSPSSYLLLNAVLPCLASAAAIVPIIRQPLAHLLPLRASAAQSEDTHIFLALHILAFLTGLYLLFFNSLSSVAFTAGLLLVGAVLLLLLPICVPGIVHAHACAWRSMYSGNWFNLKTHINDLAGLHERLISKNADDSAAVDGANAIEQWEAQRSSSCRRCCWRDEMIGKDRLTTLGEEHSAMRLVHRVDFWLYYIAYFCGATIGLVYSNNIGQIAQSLGRAADTTMLVNVYSSCSFFGRLLSSTPDFLRGKVHFARTGWLVVAMLPTPLAFLLLAEVNDRHALLWGTALLGLSSGFIFATAVSVTSELFGFDSMGVNHNLLITNIPMGSLLYGLLAAVIYDSNGEPVTSTATGASDEMVVCMGRKCYAQTFLWWGCISLVGLVSIVVLYLRTRTVYIEAERRHPLTESGSQEEVK